MLYLHLTWLTNGDGNGDGDGDYGVGDDGDGDGDIYIMMKCLCVTKNDHLLKRPLCLFVYFNGLSSLRK